MICATSISHVGSFISFYILLQYFATLSIIVLIDSRLHQPIKLLTNWFQIYNTSKWTAYKYSVSLTPEVDSRRLRIRIVKGTPTLFNSPLRSSSLYSLRHSILIPRASRRVSSAARPPISLRRPGAVHDARALGRRALVRDDEPADSRAGARALHAPRAVHPAERRCARAARRTRSRRPSAPRAGADRQRWRVYLPHLRKHVDLLGNRRYCNRVASQSSESHCCLLPLLVCLIFISIIRLLIS